MSDRGAMFSGPKQGSPCVVPSIGESPATEFVYLLLYRCISRRGRKALAFREVLKQR